MSEEKGSSKEGALSVAGSAGVDLFSSVLKDEGPVVTCVLLKASANVPDEKDANCSSSPVLTDQIEEIQLDTTPSKSMVVKTLGGPFTFLGQYEDEGVVLMIRKVPAAMDENELKSLKITELLPLCEERQIDRTSLVEKSDLVQAIVEYQTTVLPLPNKNKLQPPFDNAVVRGDILVLKVAETSDNIEEADGEDHNEECADAIRQQIQVLSNEEFFLNYTKEEWLHFASRTDVVYEQGGSNDSDKEEENVGDDAKTEEQVGGDDDDDDENLVCSGDELLEGEELSLDDLDEEDKYGMFNIVMYKCLQQYREENGRGPNTQELLELRSMIAKEVDVEVADVDGADWDKKAKTSKKESPKKIGFHSKNSVFEFVPDPNEHLREELDDDATNQESDGDDSDEDDEDYTPTASDPTVKTEEDITESNEPPRKRLKQSTPD